MTASPEKSFLLSESDLEGVIGGTAANTPGVGGIADLDLQSMDIEAAMMMVQQQRTSLLDAQLKAQVEGVQNRNTHIAQMNEVLGATHSAEATFASDAKPSDILDSHSAQYVALTDAAKVAGVDLSDYLKDGLTKGDIDILGDRLKSQIDAEGNSQQMEMLRLQSLGNKRNEAFDLMTNFVKKMQDSRSSIIGNMR